MPWEHDLTGREPLVECELALGQPELVAHNELVLRGWAASPRGISGVAVQIDDRVWNAAYGLDTPAVARRFPDIDAAERAGYHLAIDTSGWKPGPRVVTVAAFDSDGRRSAVEGTVEVRPFAVPARQPLAALEDGDVALSLDSPAIEAGVAEVEGALDVRGWAHAPDGIEAVLVTLDGTVQYEALGPVVRPDLLGELGRDDAAEAGFALRIDPIDCPPGSHRLAVEARSRDGRTAGVECELVCRPVRVAAAEATELAPAAARAGAPVTDAERMWESRALLAEADAALARAEARFARTGEERALRQLARGTTGHSRQTPRATSP